MSRKIFIKWFTGSIIILFSALALATLLVFRKEDSRDFKPDSVKEVDTCTRKEPYHLEPEFERAISFIEQRFSPIYAGNFLTEMKNCLNIQYGELHKDGAEGMFYFDNTVSSPNNLVISVDRSYLQKDDYMTAILLVHEITHARQFYTQTTKSCVDIEVEAFWNEFLLTTKFNEGEKKALLARMYNPNDYPSSDQNIRQLEETMDLLIEADKNCSGNTKCKQDKAIDLLRTKISSSPFYQKQCQLN